MSSPNVRVDNRNSELLAAAAKVFRNKGFAAATVRDITSECGMHSGSLYYHFACKEDLLVAVYERGAEIFVEKLQNSIAGIEDPWMKIEQASIAHISCLLFDSDFSTVVVRIPPRDVPQIEERLRTIWYDYEKIFRELLKGIEGMSQEKMSIVLSMLLGALNWTQSWFVLGKRDSKEIASAYVAIIKKACEG